MGSEIVGDAAQTEGLARLTATRSGAVTVTGGRRDADPSTVWASAVDAYAAMDAVAAKIRHAIKRNAHASWDLALIKQDRNKLIHPASQVIEGKTMSQALPGDRTNAPSRRNG